MNPCASPVAHSRRSSSSSCSAFVGGFFGRSAVATQERVPDRYRVFTAALAADRDAIRREGRVRPASSTARSSGMLQTLDPHSSFLDPRTYAQMRERQEGPLLRPRHHHPGRRRRHHGGDRCSRGRRPTRRASAAATSSRDRGRGREGLDQRQGASAALRGPEGHDGRDRRCGGAGYDQLIDLDGRARRDQHPDHPRRRS